MICYFCKIEHCSKALDFFFCYLLVIAVNNVLDDLVQLCLSCCKNALLLPNFCV
jgi:hypothetical protein